MMAMVRRVAPRCDVRARSTAFYESDCQRHAPGPLIVARFWP